MSYHLKIVLELLALWEVWIPIFIIKYRNVVPFELKKFSPQYKYELDGFNTIDFDLFIQNWNLF